LKISNHRRGKGPSAAPVDQWGKMRSWNIHAAICLFLILLPLVVFYQVYQHDIVSYDDPVIVENSYIQKGPTLESIIWAFTAIPDHTPYWIPVTLISHMVDYRFFGTDFGHHHLMSLFLHIANSLLLFWVLSSATGQVWPSAFAGACFAIHPLNVEVVSWLVGRNSILALFFGLLSLGVYIGYVRRLSPGRYFLALFLFFLAMAAKPEIAPIATVFLLFDYWPMARTDIGPSYADASRRPLSPRRSVQWLMLEKLPFLAMAGIAALMAGLLNAGAVRRALETPVFRADAVVAFLTAMRRTVWPVDLTLIRALRTDSVSWVGTSLALLLLICITLLVVRYRSLRPYLVTGWFWFVLALSPIVVMLAGSDRVLADRHTYFPLIGLCVLSAWLLADLAKRFRRGRPVMACAAVVAIAVLAVVSNAHVRHFKNSEVLYRHAITVAPENIQAHTNLADALLEKHRIKEAIAHYRTALSIDPENALVYNNLGAAFLQAGNTGKAAECFRQALRYDPGHAMAHNNLGNLLLDKGETDAAIAHFEKALTADNPFAYMVHNNLATAFANKGNLEKAIFHLQQALLIKPDYVTARENLRRIRTAPPMFPVD